MKNRKKSIIVMAKVENLEKKAFMRTFKGKNNFIMFLQQIQWIKAYCIHRNCFMLLNFVKS